MILGVFRVSPHHWKGNFEYVFGQAQNQLRTYSFSHKINAQTLAELGFMHIFVELITCRSWYTIVILIKLNSNVAYYHEQ